jgi:hypothetical protein
LCYSLDLSRVDVSEREKERFLNRQNLSQHQIQKAQTCIVHNELVFRTKDRKEVRVRFVIVYVIDFLFVTCDLLFYQFYVTSHALLE